MKANTNPDSDVARTLKIDQPHGYGRWVKRLIVVALVVIAAIAGVVIWRTSGKSNTPQYKTEEVRRGD